MFFKVDIMLSLAISLFIFYLSAEAFDSNDVTDSGGKRGDKGDTLKKTDVSRAIQHGKEIPSGFSTARFHSKTNVINRDIVPTSVNAKSGTVSRPNMSSRIAPLALDTFSSGLKHNDITPISDLTVNQPLLVGVTKSYATVATYSQQSQHPGLLRSTSSITSFPRASSVGNLQNGFSHMVKPNGLLKLASQNRENTTGGYSLRSSVVKPNLSASVDHSNIFSTKATSSRQFSRTSSDAITNSDSNPMTFNYLPPTTSIFMSELATPHPGRLENSVNTVLAVATSSKIKQKSLNSSSLSLVVGSLATSTISLNSGSRVLDLQDKLHSADSQTIITPRLPFSEVNKIQTREIRSSIPINNRSASYSKSITPYLERQMNYTTESKYRVSSIVSKHNLLENGTTVTSVRLAVKAVKPTRSMSDVDRTSFQLQTSEGLPSSSHSAMPSLTVTRQQSISFSQLESTVLGPVTTLTTSCMSLNAPCSLSSLRDRQSVINITHAFASATPVSTEALANSSLNETRAFILGIATDVGIGSSLGVTATVFEPSSGLSRSQLQQNRSHHTVSKTPPILSTSFTMKYFFATPVSSRSSFSQSKTKSILLSTSAPKPQPYRSSGIPAFNSTRQSVPASVAVLSSAYISRSGASVLTVLSSKPTGVASSILPTVKSALLTSSIPLLTATIFSKTKRIFATSTGKVGPTRMTAKTTATTTPTTTPATTIPATTMRSTQKERPVTEPRVTSHQPIYIGEPKVHTKLIAKYPSALNIEFDVSFPGISEAYKMQIIAQKYDRRAIADKSNRLRTWYEVHYFEDHKHEPYIVSEFTKKHTVKRPTFNFTIGSDAQCEVKQVRFRYCNGPLHKGDYRPRIFKSKKLYIIYTILSAT